MANIDLIKYIPLYHGSWFGFKFNKSNKMIKGQIGVFCIYENECTLHGDFLCNWGDKDSPTEVNTNEGELKLILKDPATMSDSMRYAYYQHTKSIIIHSENKSIRIDTPQSILFLLQNSIDAFDLLNQGIAVTYRDFLVEWKLNTYIINKNN